MTPIDFPGTNVLLGKGQPQYQALPAHCDHSTERVMTTCWELSEVELAQIKLTGRLWIQQLTFGRPFQPMLPSTTKPETP
jgi:hypothetical protein